MGIYAVTGGTKGIGEKTIEILRARGHEVINIDVDDGDIPADLGTAEGRESVITYMHEHYPDGVDGLVCNAGIAGLPRFKNSYVLSVNYFGAVAIAEGLYDLLRIKNGNCAVTVSGAIVTAKRDKFFVDELLNNCGDENRIGRLVDSFSQLETANIGNIMYLSAKIALARWVRRVSSSWAARGVNINAVGPGGVATTIMHGFIKPDEDTYYYPMPALFGQNRAMDPIDVAQALAYLVLPEAKGISGVILFCDAGASAVFDTEKYI